MDAFFERFYEKYHSDIYNFVFYMVKNKSLTEDLVQEVYIRIMKAYRGFRGESSEKTWAFSIARNVVIDYFRKEYRKRKGTKDEVDWEEMSNFLPSDQAMPDEILIQNEDIKQIYQLLDKCSLDQKQVIILRYIQGCTLKETAKILNLSLSNIKTIQHRGIKKLKSLLQAEGEKRGMMNG